ncbi:uncharacterized protein LOC119973802 [Scyliorhinus canicula]|uniref:uncharacterized protein LOC119973802 n=1 Tax=Scyliorhinus canicula TaxID=7830 RepID=UPI0018F7A3EB|nr:uncharacterized protein LOC119973802 [Scyliorhinus canicula]
MTHRDMDRSSIVKTFSTVAKLSGPDSEIESSSLDSQASSKQIVTINEKTHERQEITVDSSPWDSEEEGLSKHKEVNEQKRPCCSVKFPDHQTPKRQTASTAAPPSYEGFKETLKESSEKHLQSASKSQAKNRYNLNMQVPYLSSVSRNKATALEPATNPSYSGWSDSSSETQPIFSFYERANNHDNPKKKGEEIKDKREEQKLRKGRIKETLKKNLQSFSPQHKSSQTSSHVLSKQNSVSSQLLVGEWEKERKATNKTQSERGEYKTELGQTNTGFTEESIEPTNMGIASEENIVVGIVKDAANYKDNRQVYHFDFGHQYFYETKKEYTETCISKAADWSDDAIRQCWRNLFAMVKILVNMVTLFFIELVNFVCRSIFQVLLVGLLVVIGDHLLKPLLAALFNSLLQPIMIFLLNIFIGIRNLLNPLIDIFRKLLLQIAAVLHAFRLVEVNLNQTPSSYREV